MNRMNITIWLTHKCNMNCVYCYEKNKGSENMSMNMARKVCNYIRTILFDKKIKICTIHFHGGEPFLENSLISYFIKKLSEIKNIDFLYSITTNGTIVDEKVLSNLRKMYDVNISLDGEEKNQNENRPMIDGGSSNEILTQNLKKLIDNEIEYNVRMTITPQNIKNMNYNIDYIYSMGVKNIICAIDYWNYHWSLQDIEEYKIEIAKARKKYEIEQDVHISGIQDGCNTQKGTCLGGIKNRVIDCDGSIYPCTVVCGNISFRIGSVEEDVQEDWIRKLNVLNMFCKNKCNDCSQHENCQARRCIFLGFANDNLLPNLCLIQKNSIGEND